LRGLTPKFLELSCSRASNAPRLNSKISRKLLRQSSFRLGRLHCHRLRRSRDCDCENRVRPAETLPRLTAVGRPGRCGCSVTSSLPYADWTGRCSASDWPGPLPSQSALRPHFLSARRFSCVGGECPFLPPLGFIRLYPLPSARCCHSCGHGGGSTAPQTALGQGPGGRARGGDPGCRPTLAAFFTAVGSHGAQPEWHDSEATLPQGLAATSGHLVQPASPEDPQVHDGRAGYADPASEAVRGPLGRCRERERPPPRGGRCGVVTVACLPCQTQGPASKSAPHRPPPRVWTHPAHSEVPHGAVPHQSPSWPGLQFGGATGEWLGRVSQVASGLSC
jgi:hypothetical protein